MPIPAFVSSTIASVSWISDSCRGITPAGMSRRWYSATRATKNKPQHLREFEQFVARAVTGEPELVQKKGAIAPRPLTLAS